MAARLLRSLMFVPGNNPRFLEKAPSLQADLVCLDLEDSVPGPEKAAARDLVAGALERAAGRPLYVRINSPESGMVPEDLAAAARPGLAGIVVPKVHTAADVLSVESELALMERERGIGISELLPSVESALGAVNCRSIASASQRAPAVVFGVFDLLADMGIEYAKGAPGAEHARARVALEAAAAGVAAIDGIWQDIADPEGLAADCAAGRALGYAGKSVIHPSQLGAVHEAFRPGAGDVGWARRVRAAYEEAAAGGRGATSVDGKMVDEVHYRQAGALLEAAGAGTK